MPEYYCNTSPLQYLHQLGRIEILSALTGGVVVPTSVAEELDAGRAGGCDVPELQRFSWISIRQPKSAPALPLAADLGRGEAGVPALALESNDAMVLLDDAVARRAAHCWAFG